MLKKMLIGASSRCTLKLPYNQVVRCSVPSLLRVCSTNLNGFSSSSTSSSTQTDDYFDKNKQMKRPLSPYIQYKPQITSVLSISHRFTGLGLAVLLYAGGISALWSSTTNFGVVLANIHAAVPHPAITVVKVLAGTSLVYHTLNGIRHLAWDLGYGFNLKQLYTSGYIVLGLTLIAYIILVYYNRY